ncbi:MAG: phage head closure protein [Bacillota bacterium]
MLRAGELNRRITLQAKTVTYVGGFATEEWGDVATVWAKVITTGGGEFYAAQRQIAETTCLFCIRHRAGLTAKMRIMFDGRTFDILAINPVDGKKEEIRISAKEVL